MNEVNWDRLLRDQDMAWRMEIVPNETYPHDAQRDNVRVTIHDRLDAQSFTISRTFPSSPIFNITDPMTLLCVLALEHKEHERIAPVVESYSREIGEVPVVFIDDGCQIVTLRLSKKISDLDEDRFADLKEAVTLLRSTPPVGYHVFRVGSTMWAEIASTVYYDIADLCRSSTSDIPLTKYLLGRCLKNTMIGAARRFIDINDRTASANENYSATMNRHISLKLFVAACEAIPARLWAKEIASGLVESPGDTESKASRDREPQN